MSFQISKQMNKLKTFFISENQLKRKASLRGFCWKLGISAKQFQVPNPLPKENQKNRTKYMDIKRKKSK